VVLSNLDIQHDATLRKSNSYYVHVSVTLVITRLYFRVASGWNHGRIHWCHARLHCHEYLRAAYTLPKYLCKKLVYVPLQKRTFETVHWFVDRSFAIRMRRYSRNISVGDSSSAFA
jgi:hypothetical protein